MDWELYERYRATLILMGVAFVSFLLLAFQRTSVVRALRVVLVSCTLPTERYLSRLKELPPVEESASPAATPSGSILTPSLGTPPEERRMVQVLSWENQRLHGLLELKQDRWPAAVAAHVAGRDPQRWFQEIVLDKGKDDGLMVDSPVIAVAGGQEGLVGRVTEVANHVAKVMLVQDSLSALAVTVLGSVSEDGIVEGSNGHDLILKFIDRSSHIKIGDRVVTSGLGKTFPEGISVGWVEDVALDPRQLFLQARLRPAVPSNQIHAVLVLVNHE
jgi:hypothetical protein